MSLGRFLAVAILSAPLITPAALAAPCALTDLAWMAADWQSAEDPKGSEERWVETPDHALMGSSFEMPSGKKGYAEIMTVRQDGDAVAMLLRHFDGGLAKAWEEREAPMRFNLAGCGKTSAVFDGQGDHAGEHLTYTRAGDKLTIVGDFLHKGVPDREEWHMVKAKN